MNDAMNHENTQPLNAEPDRQPDSQLDPQLDSLLDEAMSPLSVDGGQPAELCDRIMQATAHQLPSAADQSPVIGRIGSPRVLILRRIAAVLILFAWIGAAFVVFSIVRDAKTNLTNLATVENVLEHVAHATPEVAIVADEVEPIDNALDQLEVDIELAISSTTTSWEELTAEFEAELDMLDPGA